MTGSSAQRIGFGRTDCDAIANEMLAAGIDDYLHVGSNTPSTSLEPHPYCFKCNHDHPIGGTCIGIAPPQVMAAVRPPHPVTPLMASQGLICPTCTLTTCVGKIPGEECETTETDHDSWWGYLVDARGQLASTHP